MNPVYAKKLSLRIQKTDVDAQKIDRCSLDIFEIVITSFQAQNKLGNSRFFQETFLVANTRMDVVLEMIFLTLRNANIQFVEGDLIWWAYTAAKTLSTTKFVQIIDWQEFAKVVLNPNKEVLVVYVATITSKMALHLAGQVQIALLKA